MGEGGCVWLPPPIHLSYTTPPPHSLPPESPPPDTHELRPNVWFHPGSRAAGSRGKIAAARITAASSLPEGGGEGEEGEWGRKGVVCVCVFRTATCNLGDKKKPC